MMTLRTAEGLGSAIARHHRLRSEFSWIDVDEEDGEKGGVKPLQFPSSLRSTIC